MDLSTLVKMSNTYAAIRLTFWQEAVILLSKTIQPCMLKVLVHSLLRSKQKNLSKWTEPV